MMSSNRFLTSNIPNKFINPFMDKEKLELQNQLRTSLSVIRKLKQKLDNSKPETEPIAVVGIGCRFPGNVDSPEAFWELLSQGKTEITKVPTDRWDNHLVYDPNATIPGKTYSNCGSFLQDITVFDCQFFGISPIEAEAMDPQQRLLLVTAWRAFENAGIIPATLRGSNTGVYVGMTNVDYMQRRAKSKQYKNLTMYDATGNTSSTAAGRISYIFDFHGPSISIDTACSSSLVALHLACEDLIKAETDMSVVAGVNLMLLPNAHIIFSRMGALSRTGICRPFDNDADGFVRGEGCGVVILKRLRDALASNDNIVGVIKASGVNQDGASNGLTAPNGISQERLLRATMKKAKLEPNQIKLIEAHGTGTLLGDPIEIEAINNVFFDNREKGNDLLVGSLKSNIGHLEGAAGIAGFIKLILSLSHRAFPGTPTFTKPNQFIEWNNVLKVNKSLISIEHSEQPLYGGVSSFGFSGTNAHVIAGEYKNSSKSIAQDDPSTDLEVLTISARTQTSLQEQINSYISFLESTDVSFRRVAEASRTQRSHFENRTAILANSNEEGIKALKELSPSTFQSSVKNPTTALLFTGQGSQYGSMAKEMYVSNATFRQAFDECNALISPLLDRCSLKDIIFEDSDRVHQTQYSQPAIFTIQYALTLALQELGIYPDGLLGHSVGEYAAATLAGIFTLSDAARLIVARGKLMENVSTKGAMVAVFASPMQVQTIIENLDEEKISIAAVNAPDHTVVSGETSTIELFLTKANEIALKYKRIPVSYAFHSPVMKPIVSEFERILKGVVYHIPQTTIYPTSEARSQYSMQQPEYWIEQALKPVEFYDAYQNAASANFNIILEVGPRPILSRIVSDFKEADQLVCYLIDDKNSNKSTFYTAIAEMYRYGLDINWGSRSDYISLPGYKFEQQRYYIQEESGEIESEYHQLLGQQVDVADASIDFVWARTINLNTHPFLRDHRVNNIVLFPAAGFIEMAIAAFIEIGHKFPLTVCDIKFERPLTLEEGKSVTMQLQLTHQNYSEYSFAVFSRIKGATEWVKHVVGTVKSFIGEKPAPIASIQEIANSVHKRKDRQSFYEDWYDRGNQWGATFKGLEYIAIADGKSVSHITVPAEIEKDYLHFYAHPGLMDACGQGMAEVFKTKNGAFVGKEMKSITLFSRFDQPSYFSIATAQKLDSENTERMVAGDIIVTDEDGEVMAVTSGIAFDFIHQVDITSRLYKIDWKNLSVRQEDKKGGKFLFVHPVNNIVSWLNLFVASYKQSALLWDHQTFLHRLNDLSGNETIVFVFGKSSEITDQHLGIEEAVANMEGLTHALLQLSEKYHSGIRIWAITEDVWTSNEKSSILGWLWGFGRSAAVEVEKIWGGIIDVDSSTSLQQIQDNLKYCLSSNTSMAEFRVTQKSILKATLNLAGSPEQYPRTNKEIHEVTVIAGGTGGLGLVTAEWLARQTKIKEIILLSRSGIDGLDSDSQSLTKSSIEKKRILDYLFNSDVKVILDKVDISDVHALDAWHKEKIVNQGKKITGFIHAAGSTDIAPLSKLSRENISAQFNAKVTGALYFHNLLKNEEVNFFIFFSSASSIINSKGLAAYAAANSVLDAIAYKRAMAGLPILNLNWAAWKDRGLIANAAEKQGVSLAGDHMITTEFGLQVLNAAKNWQVPQLVVLPQKFHEWSRLLPWLTKIDKFSHLENNSSGTEGYTFLQASENNISLNNWLKNQLARILKLEEKQIEENKPISEFGLDSMLAIDFKNSIEKGLGVDLPVIELIKGPTIEELTIQIVTLTQNRNITESKKIMPFIHMPCEYNKDLPLSQGQTALFALAQINPSSVAYHVSFTCKIHLGLQSKILKVAVDNVTRKHLIFQTTFSQPHGSIVQRIRKDHELHYAEFELFEDERFSNEEFLYDKVTENYRKPFSLSDGPLLRLNLFKISEEQHILLITVHHIVCDGWSLWLLLNELQKEYSSLLKGANSGDTDEEFNYFDFVNWQARYLENEAAKKAEEYWAGVLRKEVPVLNLPFSWPRMPGNAGAGATIPFSIDQDLTEKITAYSRTSGYTFHTILLAAFKILLYRFCRQEDICVGTPTSGRSAPEMSDIIGDFINLLPIRITLTAALQFSELVAIVRSQMLSALEYQDYPFPLMVKNCHHGHEAGISPFFQTLFSFQQPHIGTEMIRQMDRDTKAVVQWGDMQISSYRIPQQEGQFDLTFEMMESSGAFSGVVKYDDNLFSEAVVHQMVESYIILIRECVANPAVKIGEVKLLSDVQLDRIINSFNQTWYDFKFVPVPVLIEMQCRHTPDRIAVVFEDQGYSYRELEEKSIQLSNLLIKNDIGRGDIVGICQRRSAEIVISMLAVWKAGAAYLPLDPTYPDERILFIAEDASLKLVLTESGILSSAVRRVIKTLSIDLEKENILRQPQVSSQSPPIESDLAYIIYTSGSTGQPKGTLIEHGALHNFVEGMSQRLGSTSGVMLAVTTVTFDIAVLELLWTLVNGFKVVILGESRDLLTATNVPEESALSFGLFYFSSEDAGTSSSGNKYNLLLEGAKFADDHGFSSIWTPERHFHSFGGLFPNPTVTSAALSTITKQISIRAGSIVMPLHHPVRIAEEWSVIDNLSNGRIGISFASGWQVNDFVLAPGNYAEKNKLMYKAIEDVKSLWRGESLQMTNGNGQMVSTRVHPEPIQKELPVWITAAGSIETFTTAGSKGFYLLTHLLGQSLSELEQKIKAYHRSWRAAGHAGEGKVTLMLHTFIGDGYGETIKVVEKPFKNYLRSSLDLFRVVIKSFGKDIDEKDFSEDDKNSLLDHAFKRYLTDGSLIGTVESCLKILDKVQGIGVDEIACLIDFGVEEQQVLASLPKLYQLMTLHQRKKKEGGYSITRQLIDHNVTHFQCTPSMANLLLRDKQIAHAFRNVKTVMLGGEKLTENLVQLIKEKTHARIFNMYGPTETTIWSAVKEVTTPSDITIGAPIANTQLYILDERMQVLPVGVAGELYIGGKGLSSGYLRREELTQEKFVCAPHDIAGKPRVYRTGDIVRFLESGEIEFIGREDSQVKIRGHRIELGEIEKTLLKHEHVGHAVVVTTKDHQPKRLICYVTLKVSLDSFTEELSAHVRRFLPSYMVPSKFVKLDAFPLTHNGKVDRKLLPKQTIDEQTVDNNALTPIEQKLITLWQEILGIEHVNVRDNFFTLGGDSILAIQLVSRGGQLGLKFTVNHLFNNQTVKSLALVTQELQPLSPAELAFGPFQLMPIHHWFIEQNLANPNHYNQSILLNVPDEYELSQMSDAVKRLIEVNDSLRLRIICDQGQWSAYIQEEEANDVFDVIDLRSLPEHQATDRLQHSAAQLQESLSITTGPIIRVRCYVLDTGTKVLWCIHHIGVDGVSWRILLNEFKDIMESRRTVEFKHLSYKSWATRLHEYAHRREVDVSMTFWKKFIGCKSLPLPGITASGENTVGSADSIERILGEKHTAQLFQHSAKLLRAGIDEILLAALVKSLDEIQPKGLIIIDVERHGRSDPFSETDFSQTTGWLTALGPVPLQLGHWMTVQQCLVDIKDQVRSIPGQNPGFFSIIKYLHSNSDQREDIRGVPSAHILFNYLGQFNQGIPYSISNENIGLNYDEANKRSHPWEIISMVINGQLKIQLNYSHNMHKEDFMQGIANSIIANLYSFMDISAVSDELAVNTSDFPAARATKTDLQKVLFKFKKS